MARQCKCTASLMQCTATCTANVVETFEYIWKEMIAISHYTNQSICVTECLVICKAVLLHVTYLFESRGPTDTENDTEERGGGYDAGF